MDAVTYPDERIRGMLERQFIPVRLPHNHEPLADVYRVRRTPTLAVLDADGGEHHRLAGFRAPETLARELRLGLARLAFDAGDCAGALGLAGEVLQDVSPDAPDAPAGAEAGEALAEALWIVGVCLQRAGEGPRALKAMAEELAARHPGSAAALRARKYLLL